MMEAHAIAEQWLSVSLDSQAPDCEQRLAGSHSTLGGPNRSAGRPNTQYFYDDVSMPPAIA
jgi:hypothetical protein